MNQYTLLDTLILKCDIMWVVFFFGCWAWALLINLCVSKHFSPIRPHRLLLLAGIQQKATKLLLVQSRPAHNKVYWNLLNFCCCCCCFPFFTIELFNILHNLLGLGSWYDRVEHYRKPINWGCERFSVVIQTELHAEDEKSNNNKQTKQKMVEKLAKTHQ